MSSIFWIYDYLLEKKIKKHDLPDHIGVILDITEFKKENIDKFLNWCSEFEIDKVSIYISIKDSKDTKKIEEKIKNIQNTQNKKNNLIDKIPKKKLDKEKKDVKYDVSIGFGGRKEFIDVLKDLGKEIKKDNLDPEDIDKEKIEEKLIFDGEPDLLIKTGSEHLSDFMLWQSVYSEHYFADFNWKNLRKRDFLRTIQEFQQRERRYGK